MTQKELKRIEMCKKVKDVKQEELNRLKEKYSYVLNGRLEMNLSKISNFVNLVLPVLVLQFLEQENLRYKCNFDCNKTKRSFASKFAFIQHLCLKHTDELPGGGLFLLQRQEKTLAKIRQKDPNIYYCNYCAKVYRRKKALENHEEKCSQKNEKDEDIIEEITLLEESFSTIILD